MASFKGVHRRFEYRFRSEHRVVIDDYAHHPTELAAAIGTVRELYPGKRILGVFQPHLYSRTRDFADGFADSLSAAYYQVVLAGLDLKTLNQSLSNAEERLRLAGEQQRIGTRPASDVLLAKMDLNQLKNRILAQKKQIEIRKGALNLMMGREPDLDFVPADTVQLPDHLPFSQWKNKVLERNLNLKIQKENLEISKLTVGETKARFYPQINLNSALNYQRSSSTAGFALFNRNVGPQAGLSFTMPLFSGVPVSRLVRMADR
jgi:outer membrane protein TolC